MPLQTPLENLDPSPEALFSMNALRRAWQQVRRSGDSPGVDGIRFAQFEADLEGNLATLRRDLLSGTYRPQPVRRFFIRKTSGKQRPISLWCLRDRIAQRVIHDYLLFAFEQIFLDCNYGFRPGRGTQQAIEAITRARDAGWHWVLDADIADCFGSIPLDILLAQVERVVPSAQIVHLIRQWLWVPVQGVTGETAGVSQGGVISPQLANLYLHRFDEMMLAALPQSKLIRFADDFVVLNRSEEESNWSLEVSRRSLANLRLNLNMRKTRLVTFAEGFLFLGVTFSGDRIVRKNQEE